MLRKDKLILVAAVMWAGVGIMLNGFAMRWVKEITNTQIIVGSIIGITIAVFKSLFVFRKLVDKNVERIKQLDYKTSVLRFQKGSSYILIVGMISLGIFLRKTGYVPKNILFAVYVAVGWALFLSSFFYFSHFFKYKRELDAQAA